MTEQVPEKRPAGEVTDRLLEEVHGDADMSRPLPTSAGALLILLRAVAGAFVALHIYSHLAHFYNDAGLDLNPVTDPDGYETAQIVFVAGNIIQLLFYVVLAAFIYFGRNWARILMMLLTVISISTSFVTWLASDLHLTSFTHLLSIALDILILLALSSRDSAAYAQRRRRT